MRYTITIFAIIALFACGCLPGAGEDVSAPSPDSISAPTKDELVIQNCYLTRDAVEAFAAENDGFYPSDWSDRLPDGRTLLNFLPGESRLVNPYTGAATMPVFLAPAGSGETGFVGQNVGNGPPTGYHILGQGGGDDIIFTIIKEP